MNSGSALLGRYGATSAATTHARAAKARAETSLAAVGMAQAGRETVIWVTSQVPLWKAAAQLVR